MCNEDPSVETENRRKRKSYKRKGADRKGKRSARGSLESIHGGDRKDPISKVSENSDLIFGFLGAS